MKKKVDDLHSVIASENVGLGLKQTTAGSRNELKKKIEDRVIRDVQMEHAEQDRGSGPRARREMGAKIELPSCIIKCFLEWHCRTG